MSNQNHTESINPSGLCECGCGDVAPIAKQSLTRRGHIRGESVRFIQGHMFKKSVNGGHGINWKGGRKIHEDGYIQIWKPNHSNANANGYVYEHVLIASEMLGRKIPDGVIVHHVNNDPSDNHPNNLVICENRSYHRLIHRREQAFKECGNANWRRCGYCGTWDAPENLYIPSGISGPRHVACATKYMREYRERNLK